MSDSVRVVYRKYDGSLHWHLTMRRLGEDEHGVWLGLPTGGEMRKGDGPAVPIPQAHVLLIPSGAWWTASFNARPCWTEIYCDITTPVEFGEDVFTMVDLDLDVIKKRDGSVIIDDEDEFAEHQVKYGYPAEVIDRAQATADWLVTAVVTEEPFLTVYKTHLDKVR